MHTLHAVSYPTLAKLVLHVSILYRKCLAKISSEKIRTLSLLWQQNHGQKVSMSFTTKYSECEAVWLVQESAKLKLQTMSHVHILPTDNNPFSQSFAVFSPSCVFSVWGF